MIILDADDGHRPEPDRTEDMPDRSQRELLIACATEARRHAADLVDLDATLGAALSAGTPPKDALDATFLQRIDLLRQEAQGLANLLTLLSDADTGTTVAAQDIAARVPTAKQRHRIFGP